MSRKFRMNFSTLRLRIMPVAILRVEQRMKKKSALDRKPFAKFSGRYPDFLTIVFIKSAVECPKNQ